MELSWIFYLSLLVGFIFAFGIGANDVANRCEDLSELCADSGSCGSSATPGVMFAALELQSVAGR